MADRTLLRAGTALAPPLFMQPGELAYSPGDGRLWLADFGGVGQPTTGTGVTTFNGRAGPVILLSADVTTALTFTPYDAANPAGYLTSAALSSYATKASPAFSGTPTAPTAPLGTNSTQLATMAAVKAAIDALIAGAPGALDTLKEISDQLATDESAVSALTTAVGTKLAKSANLSDITDTAVARTNLGLGGAAVLSVGTAAGTVAAGNAALSPATAATTYATKASPQITGDATIGTEKVNQLVLKGATAGAGASVAAAGSDVNIDLNLSPKGAGKVQTAAKVVLYSGISLINLPTSASGLGSGDVWRNGTVLNIVP